MNLVVSFLADPAYFAITVGSLVIATMLLLASRNKQLSVTSRVFLIYAHIALLIVPVAFFAYSSGCMIPAYDCNVKTLLYSLPFIIGGAVVAAGVIGYFALPQLYRRRFSAKELKNAELRKFVSAHARRMRLRTPSLFLLDTATPVAFSFSSYKPAIFLSLGMFDVLSKKEIESVVLHELGHIKHRSPLMKFSTKLVKLVSPVALFVPMQSNLSHEECYADAFAVKVQGTAKYVTSARQKIEDFYAFQG